MLRRNGSDTFRYRYPLGGAVVGTFAALGLRVKTLDLGLVDGGIARRCPLVGVIVELYFPWF
jgi:hypothetical protein